MIFWFKELLCLNICNFMLFKLMLLGITWVGQRETFRICTFVVKYVSTFQLWWNLYFTIVPISCIYLKVLGVTLVKIKLIWLAYKTFTFYVMNTADWNACKYFVIFFVKRIFNFASSLLSTGSVNTNNELLLFDVN